MKTLVERFGKLITASILLMEIEAVIMLLTPLSLLFWDTDLNIFGAIVLIAGVLLFAAGFIIRKTKSKNQ